MDEPVDEGSTTANCSSDQTSVMTTTAPVTTNLVEGSNYSTSVRNHSQEEGTGMLFSVKRCNQSSEKSRRDTTSSSNGLAPDDWGRAELPADIKTPPLAPSQVSSEPVNGNRNNLSDNARAYSANFKSSLKALDVGWTISDKISVQHSQNASKDMKYNGGSPGHLSRTDVVPPALVIIEDRKESQDNLDPNTNEKLSKNIVSSLQNNGIDHQHISVNEEQNGPLQSTKVTSANSRRKASDPASSEDEEVEEMDLVLVEDEEEPENLTGSSYSRSTAAVRDAGSTVSNVSAGKMDGPLNKSADATINKVGTRSVFSAAANSFNKEHRNNPSSGDGIGVTAQDNEGFSEGNGRKSQKAASVISVKQAAKVKQFFTTIQQCGNKMGSEVAEQVQELIHALMNETATVEEFHQEIQTITNYPIKDFIIPFLRENIGYLRAELKNSNQVLSEILGEVPTSSAVTLTPQLVDDELPVLPSSSKASATPTIWTISSSIMLNSSNSKTTSTSSYVSSSSSRNSGPHFHTTNHHVHGTGMNVQAQSHSHNSVVGIEDGSDSRTRHGSSNGVSNSGVRKRMRRLSTECGGAGHVNLEKDGTTEKSWPKRICADMNNNNTIIISTPRQPPPAYSHPPPPISLSYPSPVSHSFPPPPPSVTRLVNVSTTTRPASGDNLAIFSPFNPDHFPRKRGTILTEDWGHVDMMLSSIQGMVERTRQSMSVLKDRVSTTHTEIERKEVEKEGIIKQRVNEAVEKIKRQSTEEKQRLLLEASKQLRDAVATVKAEVEGKMQQAQAMAVQEALKEANIQTNSKESCWNCGRRATETCSGCNKARYCGTFCQHKDWASHMHHCASGLQGQGTSVTEEVTYTSTHDLGRVHHRHQATVALSTGEVALKSAGRAIPVVSQPHQRTMAIPVNLIAASPQEVNLHLASPGHHPSKNHPEIFIKTEKT